MASTYHVCDPTMGRLEMHTGLKLNSRGYSSMGLSVPERRGKCITLATSSNGS